MLLKWYEARHRAKNSGSRVLGYLHSVKIASMIAGVGVKRERERERYFCVTLTRRRRV